MTTITEVVISNFMGITEAAVDVDGTITEIVGPNGAGKTSFVSGVLGALAGRAGQVDKPVREGAEAAEVRVLAAGEYEFEITRRASVDGRTTLVVKRDGAPIKRPQEALDAMLSTLAFDPLAFAGLTPKAQVEALLDIFDADIDLDGLDAEHARLEHDRLLAGRERDRARGHAASVEVPEGTPDEPVDIAAAIEALDAAEKCNRALDDEVVELNAHEAKVARLTEKVEQLDEEMEAAELALIEATRQRDNTAARIASADRKDTAPLRETLANAEQVNAAVRAREQRDDAAEEAAAHDAEWKIFDRAMASNRRARADAVKSLGVPVDGFDLGPDGVTIDGVPSSQWSTAQAIRAGLAIFGAKRRELPLLWIKDGSLLDAASRAEVARLAAEQDLQVFVELVGETTDGGIEFRSGGTA